MSGFDFGQIGNILSTYMDTDMIDIKRDVLGELQTVYTNIPCHVTYRSSDNADPYTIATKPILQTIEIHMNVSIDVRNNDYIVIKKVSNANSILQSYSGRCGNPVVDQSRKKILVTMDADDVTEPEPLPPSDSVIVNVACLSQDYLPLQAESQQFIERGDTVTLYPPVIDGYVVIEAYLDDEKQDSLNVEIAEAVNDVYEVRFIYEAATELSYLRLLLNGLYTKDNGSLASGYYLYKKIPLTVLETNGTYKVRISNEPVIQEDTGDVIEISVGSKMVLFAGYIFVEVQAMEELVDSYILTLNPYTPTDDEKNAYLTEWYDE